MQKISSFFTSLPNSLPKNSRFKEQVVFWAFRESIGEKASKHLMPVSFSYGDLILECSDQRWMQVMDKDCEKEKMISAINSAMKSNAVHRIQILHSR
jgi:hypothetical protein